MARLRTFLMASAALAAMAIGLSTTTAQATDLRVSGITLAPSTFSTGQAGPTLKIDALKSTALQDKSFFDTTQVGQTIATNGMFKAKDLGITGMGIAGDNEAAKTGGLWALTRETAGGYGMQVQARDFDIKDVAYINRAKHPVISKFVPRQVLYVC